MLPLHGYASRNGHANRTFDLSARVGPRLSRATRRSAMSGAPLSWPAHGYRAPRISGHERRPPPPSRDLCPRFNLIADNGKPAPGATPSRRAAWLDGGC
jgi:hypothetical protein